jgi:hypothetical protein
MRWLVWGLFAMFVLPACSLYFKTSPREGEDDDDKPDGGTVSDASAPANCHAVFGYDWDDGTVQDWTSTSTVSNVGGALVFRNQGNGSLQAFGPAAPSSLVETDTISFRVQIDQYSIVSTPAKLTSSFIALQSPLPGDGSLQWPLDVSGLSFGAQRAYTFQLSAATYVGSLSRAAFLGHVKSVSLLFAEASFTSNTAAGTLDDLAIVHCE